MPRKNPGPPCEVCGDPSIAKNLCQKHYKRFARHASTDQTRPQDWGKRESHELYGSWGRTRRCSHGRCNEWKDFWVFVKDVTGKPGDGFVLDRIDKEKPFSPTNWYWREKIGSVRKIGAAAYHRLMRAKFPLKEKERNLRSQFGIGIKEYDLLMDKQNGVCAICGKEETMRLRSGKLANLAVDHCHSTGKIRGLLCSACNRGLGVFKESATLLGGAIAYLETHKK